MKRNLLVFALFCLAILFTPTVFALSPPTQSSGAVAGKWTTDLASAVNLAKTNGTYVVIFYGSTACSLCSTALRNVFDTATFYDWSLTNGIALVYANRANMSAEPGATIQTKYLGGKGAFLPTIIFVDGATDKKLKSVVFRSSDGYSNFDDFTSIAPAVTPHPVCVPEVCNGADDDCDGQIDEGLIEICNGIDDDCDGQADEDIVKDAYFLDNDGDGFGAGSPLYSCGAPQGIYVLSKTDCNDLNPILKPGAFEACDGIDNDCDGYIDDGYDCRKGSLNCTATCSFETQRITSCLGTVPQYAIAHKADNKYSEKWNGSAWVEIENKTYKFDSLVKDCTYTCNSGYYNSSNSCVPYTCSAGNDLTNANSCENDTTGLLSSVTNLLVYSCSTERKCEYYCKTGFYLGVVDGARKCLPSIYQCTGTPDANSVIYDGDNAELTVNTPITLTDSNSSKKCEYHCIKNFVLNTAKDKCIPNTFVCTNYQTLDSNAVLYTDDNFDLTSNTVSKLVSTNSSAKCEYHCRDGYYKGSGVDENKCLPNKYYCIGTVDSNAIMYPDENTNLDSNLPIRLVESDTSRKCEWFCKSGYEPGLGNNSTTCVSTLARTCKGAEYPNAELFNQDDQNISLLDNQTNVLVWDNTDLKCEWHCKSGYYLGDSTNGYVCLPQKNDEKFYCEGLIDGNSIIFTNDDKGLDNNLTRVLVDSNTSRKCEYYCKSGYYLGSVSGVEVCLPNRYSCKNSIPGAVIYLGDDSGLTSDLNVVLVASNTPRKCEYHCAKYYTKDGNTCVLGVIKSAVCGNAEKSYTSNESFPSSYSLCSVGVPSVLSPVLNNELGSVVEWVCVSDTNVTCSATRVSSPYVAPDENEPPVTNSITKLTSKVLDDGNIEITLKCQKTAVVYLDVLDYLTKDSYGANQKQIDCTASESTHLISLESVPDVERSLIIRASMNEDDSDCLNCTLDYFMDYAPSEEVEGDNFIWFIIFGVMLICIVGAGAFFVFKGNFLKTN